MKSTGIIRKIDELGRIVLPIEMRRTLEISERDALEIYADGHTIVLKKYVNTCVFCGNPGKTHSFREKNICKGCIKEIKGTQGKVTSVLLETRPGASHEAMLIEESADAVFIFVGSVPQTSLVSGGFNVDTDEAGYIKTDGCMASSVPGLFAAGDVRVSPFRQVVTAAGEGAVAAHCAAAYIDKLKGEIY